MILAKNVLPNYYILSIEKKIGKSWIILDIHFLKLLDTLRLQVSWYRKFTLKVGFGHFLTNGHSLHSQYHDFFEYSN